MKKLLFSLFGLASFLAFFAMPIYAQEENIEVDDIVAVEAENVVADAENVVADAENIVDEVEDSVEEEITVEGLDVAVEDEVDRGLSDDGIPSEDKILSGASLEEIQNALEGWAVDLGMTKEEATVLAGFLVGFGLGGLAVVVIVFVILLILGVVALWMAFRRAGEGGWKAIIPIYNTYIMFKLAGVKNWFWYSLIISIVLSLVAYYLPDYNDTITYVSQCVCGVISYVAVFLFARKYGWGIVASILFVLINPICMPFLGFGNYPYKGKSEEIIVEA